MFNHKDNNNIDHYYEDNFIIYKATRDIKKNEELFINYWDNWFIARNFNKKS